MSNRSKQSRYSITSSATASNLSGTSRPNALAVFKLNWVRNDVVLRCAGGCYATTTLFFYELREAMRSLMGLGMRRRLRVNQPTITARLIQLRTHAARYLPVFVDQFGARRLQD